MTEQRVTLRAAEPTLAEGRAFARHLDAAAEGFFRIMFGKRFAEIVAEAYIRPAHDLSFEHTTFAEHGGRIVGMASAYSAEQHRQSSDEPLRAVPGYPVMRVLLVSAFCAPVLRFLDTLNEGDFYLQSISIDRTHRGEGIGTRLIDAIEHAARVSGATRFCLDVSETNPGARRLYERLGFSVVSKSQKVLLLPRSRAFRMAKAL